MSILVPEAIDPSNDPFAGRRPQRLPNGSWPAQVRLMPSGQHALKTEWRVH